MLKKTFFSYKIKIEIKTATTTIALKNKLKYVADPNLEVIRPLR